MKYYVFSVFLLFGFALVSAQTYTEITDGGWGKGRDFVRPCFADIDHDGKLDLILGERSGTLEHLEQDSPGSTVLNSFTKTFNKIDVGSNAAPKILDIDHDGLLDLIIGNSAGTLFHYEQDTNQDTVFNLVSDLFNGIDVGGISTPSFADFDNDGLLDMLVGENEGNLNHYEQDRVDSTAFSLVTENFNNIDVGFISTPAFFDMDHDGLLDMLVGENVGHIHHFEQAGTGSRVFNLITPNFCNIDITQPCPIFADIDANGLIDFMLGDILGYVRHFEQTSVTSDSIVLRSKNILPGHDYGSLVSPFLIDIDHNDRMDLFVGSDRILVHLEQDAVGSPFFTVKTDTFSNIVTQRGYACPVFIDLDKDTLLDLLIGGTRGNIEHYEQTNPDSLTFNKVTETFGDIHVGEFSTPWVTDLDEDGFWDILVGNGDGFIFHYEQTSLDSLQFDLVSESFNNIDVPYMARPVVTDVNHDGRLDLIIGDNEGKLHHYEQDSEDPNVFSFITDTFADIRIEHDSKPIFGDINADGLDDLMIGEDDGGIYYYQREKATDIDVQPVLNSTMTQFELKPLYPNPFNPTTNINFTIKHRARVQITVFDVTGKKVETVLDEYRQPGQYSLVWDASNHATGIYFIRATADGFETTQRCLLLK